MNTQLVSEVPREPDGANLVGAVDSVAQAATAEEAAVTAPPAPESSSDCTSDFDKRKIHGWLFTKARDWAF